MFLLMQDVSVMLVQQLFVPNLCPAIENERFSAVARRKLSRSSTAQSAAP
jgi:hypothetical protein